MAANIVSKFWLVFAACALSLAWLVPNHAPPWLAFHGDAWAAVSLLPVAIWVAFKSEAKAGWSSLALVVLALAVVPWVQYVVELVPIFGVAWINSIYLLGLLLAIQTGEHWEYNAKNQCASFVFLAVLIAALVSPALQIYQWAGLNFANPWIMNVSSGGRFFANMAQPNQLGSLLLLGLLACSWGVNQRVLNGFVALAMCAFILIGVALTGSRTAWLNIFLLVAGAVVLRSKMPSRAYLYAMIGLSLYFIVITCTLPFLNQMAASGGDTELRSLADPARLGAWKMLSYASIQRPFFGFGWGQLASANFLVTSNFPEMFGLFTQAHNLFLDLILWNGYPIGTLVAAFLLWWVRQICKSVQTFEQLHLVAFLLVLGTHAMLEFPLQYAFFLLPVGLIAGSLQVSLGFKKSGLDSKWMRMVIVAASVSALAITVSDYFKIEQSFYALRFENKNIQTNLPKKPPDVIALTQFRDHLIFARSTPQTGLSDAALVSMNNTVNALPSYLVMYKMAVNYAINGRSEEARTWLTNICKTMVSTNCHELRSRWENDAVVYPAMTKVQFPDEGIK